MRVSGGQGDPLSAARYRLIPVSGTNTFTTMSRGFSAEGEHDEYETKTTDTHGDGDLPRWSGNGLRTGESPGTSHSLPENRTAR